VLRLIYFRAKVPTTPSHALNAGRVVYEPQNAIRNAACCRLDDGDRIVIRKYMIQSERVGGYHPDACQCRFGNGGRRKAVEVAVVYLGYLVWRDDQVHLQEQLAKIRRRQAAVKLNSVTQCTYLDIAWFNVAHDMEPYLVRCRRNTMGGGDEFRIALICSERHVFEGGKAHIEHALPRPVVFALIDDRIEQRVAEYGTKYEIGLDPSIEASSNVVIGNRLRCDNPAQHGR